MATVMRPSIFRQACSMAQTTRAFSTKSSAAFASSAFRTTTPLLRTRPVQSVFKPLTIARVAAFHASGSKNILPALPQKIVGTLNEGVRVPDPAPAHGSYHWSFERVIAATLVPLTVTPFVTGSLNPIMDSLLLSLIIIHTHIGFESVIIDYVPEHRVPVWRKGFMWALRLGTLLVAIGFYEFETNDVGVTEAVKRIWKA